MVGLMLSLNRDLIVDFYIVHRMTELVLQRQRTPWYWPDFLYNTIGHGKEHDRCLRILHGFTKKVSWKYYTCFVAIYYRI